MKSIADRLKDADPVAHEPPLSNEEVQQMRRLVLTSSKAAASGGARRAQMLAGVAATAALVAVFGYVSRRPEPAAAVLAPAPMLYDVVSPDAGRQLQFATPGGTRVIWVFNSDFERERSAR